MRKYEFTGETKRILNRITVKRIRRLSDGFVGGWIESETNLSHEGDCFVYDNAVVFGNATIFEDAKVCGKAKVYGSALVDGNAKVCGKAMVYGSAVVSGEAKVYRNTEVYGSARIRGKVKVTKCLYVQQPKHNITITDRDIFIGCEGHSYSYWSRNIEKIGYRHGYLDREIKNTKELLKLLKKQLKEIK